MWEEAQFLTKPLVNTKKKFGYVYLKDVYTRTKSQEVAYVNMFLSRIANHVDCPTSQSPRRHDAEWTKQFASLNRAKDYHQAILASNPLGHRRTQYFLASSMVSHPIPKAAGRNQCSTDIVLVSIVSWRDGM